MGKPPSADSGSGSIAPLLLDAPSSTPVEDRAAFAQALRSRQLTGLERLHAYRGFWTRDERSTQARSVDFTQGKTFPTLAWTAPMAEPVESSSREEAAARAIFATLRARARLLSDDWAEEIDGNPVETASYARLFSTAVIPYSWTSGIVRQYQTSHIVVLVAGRCFRIDLEDDGRAISLDALVDALATCVERSTVLPSGPAIITSGLLTEYARFYETYAGDEGNAANFGMLFSALLVVCLDDESPLSADDCGFAAQIGSPGNRWFASALQLVVSANSRIAFIGLPIVGVYESQFATFLDVFNDEMEAMRSLRVGRSAWHAVASIAWRIPEHDRRLMDARRLCVTHNGMHHTANLSLAIGAGDATRLDVDPKTLFHLVLLAATLGRLSRRAEVSQLEITSFRHTTAGGAFVREFVSPEALRFVEILRAGGDANAKRAALREAAAADRASSFAVRNALRGYVDARPPKFLRPLWKAVQRAREPAVCHRITFVPASASIPLFGRFGVAPHVDETWLSVRIGEAETTIIANAALPVRIAALRSALEDSVAAFSALSV